ncbi:hypothetical protein NP493_1749g00000 [Ridgeia piscesae]|uniref:Uncharacterized protein n=1 Tax=Ridgeia piscesae TaxID=27915 RepID=A0AAD9JTQ2_RIDPI|nr:hypothetical protein NP493_1749g00000 [Ridgeia piscesae]
MTTALLQVNAFVAIMAIDSTEDEGMSLCDICRVKTRECRVECARSSGVKQGLCTDTCSLHGWLCDVFVC